MNQQKHTVTKGCPVLVPPDRPGVGLPAPVVTNHLVLHFLKNTSNISFAATPRILCSSTVGGAERVLGERCGE